MKRVLVVAAAVLIVLVLAGWVLTRRSATSTNAAPVASLNVGKTTSRSSMSSSSSTSSGGSGSFLPLRNAVLVQVASHTIARHVGELLARHIKTNGIMNTVEVASLAKLPTNGSRAPDLFMILEMPKLEQSGVINQETKSVFHLTLGNQPWQSRSYYHDHTTPPVVIHNWTATLEHESSFSGVRTDGDRKLAQEIAAQLFKAMSNHVSSLSEKAVPTPNLPPDFYGPYEPVEEFEFLQELKAERVASYHGLLTHNETFWKFTAPGNPTPLLEELTSKAKADGWEVDSSSMTNHVRLAKPGDVEFELFPADREYAEASAARSEPREFIARYRKPFSREKRAAAIDQLITQQPPLETLIAFENMFTPAQTAQFHRMLEESPVKSPKSMLRLAEIRLRQKDTNAAVSMLKRAKVLDAVMDTGDARDLDSQIKKVAKKISAKLELDLKPAAEDYRGAGFIELTTTNSTIAVERALGEPLLCFATSAKGQETLGFLVRPPKGDSYPYVATQTQNGGRSRMSSSFSGSGSPDRKQTFAIAGRTLELTITLQPGSKNVRYNATWK